LLSSAVDRPGHFTHFPPSGEILLPVQGTQLLLPDGCSPGLHCATAEHTRHVTKTTASAAAAELRRGLKAIRDF
jgi:hypothetical protein